MANVDEEYKSNGRPTSMMAQRFSMLLDSSFGLDETSETVMKKKEEVATRAAELEELQAKLAAMEERLNIGKQGDGLAAESSHSRSRSVSQRPYLRGPIAVSVRPETPKSDQAESKPAATAGPSPKQNIQIPPRRVLSQRQRRPQPEEEDDDSEEEDDSDNSEGEQDDSETSSSEEPTRRK